MRKYKSRAIKHVAPSAYAKCLRNFTYAKWLRNASAQAKWPTQLLKSSLLYKFHHFKKNRSSFVHFRGVTSLQDQHAPACCAEYPVITPTFCAPGKKRRLVMVKWYTMTCSQVFVVHATEVVYLYYIQIDVHKRPSKKMAQFSFIGFGWLAMFIYWTHIRNYKTLGSMCKSHQITIYLAWCGWRPCRRQCFKTIIKASASEICRGWGFHRDILYAKVLLI